MKCSLSILIVCVVWLFVEKSIVESQTIPTLQTIQTFIEDLNRNEFIKVVTNVGSKMSPYLGVLSTVIKMIAENDASSKQSAELAYIRDLSQSINQKLDDVMAQFQEIKNLIQFIANKYTYATLEWNIHVVFDSLNEIFKVPSSGIPQQEQLFCTKYESTYQESGLKLFDGFMNDHGTFTEGFLRPAMIYTENDRGQMRTLMLSTLKLLVMAANVELGYYTIKNMTEIIPYYSYGWQNRFQQIQNRMNAIDLELKNLYPSQSIKDIDTFSEKNYGLSNPMFGRKLYQKLSKKYFWRDWLVIVSTHTNYDHDAHSTICHGVIKSTHGTKDLVIDSVENTTNFDIQKEANPRCMSLIQTCHNTVNHHSCSDPYGSCRQGGFQCPPYTSENADVIFKWITNLGNCSPFSSYGVINAGKNPVYYAGSTNSSLDRLFVCNLYPCNFYVHFFG